MKLIILSILLLFLVNTLFAQEKFSVPEVTTDQKIEVLYNHVIAYAVGGISFAKDQGVSPEDFGKYTGKKFATMWDTAGGYSVLVNQIMFILAGMHPENELQIVNQDDHSITLKLKNVDLAFKNGPMFGVTTNDFMEFSYGVISSVADHMNTSYKHELTDDGWYVATFKMK